MMIFVPPRSRRSRGRQQRARVISAVVIAISAALATVFRRSARDFPRHSFAGSAPWLPWALGGVVALAIIALVVVAVARSRDGDDGRDRDAEGGGARDDESDDEHGGDLRRRKMVICAIVAALTAAVIGVLALANTRHTPAAAPVPNSTSTAPRP
jgi:hypothetical protein